MSENEQKQQLSIAYLHAVAARSGYACQASIVDNDSVDATTAAAGHVHHQSVMRSPRLEVQLKATAGQQTLHDDYLAFSLPLKNYNELRERSMVPRILVVLLLPSDPNQWLEQTEEQMISRRCAYWLSLLNQPATENTNSVTVHLPRTNLLNVPNLRGLMERASRSESL